MPRVECRENGPLVVKDATGITGSDGTTAEAKAAMALCRCGRSNNKPYCDGTHIKCGFTAPTANEPAGRDKVYTFAGSTQTVLYNPRICSHAARCVATAPGAFDPSRRPWIEPDGTDVDTLRAAVRNCPSGALRIDGQDHLTDDSRATVTVEPNGPYWITGAEIDAEGPGEGGATSKAVLCRCGLSGNKPWCDGTHRDHGWKDGDN